MKTTLFLLLLCVSTNIANSRSSASLLKKNVFKVNVVLLLLIATREIFYEHFVKPNLRIAAGAGANLRTDQADDTQRNTDPLAGGGMLFTSFYFSQFFSASIN